MPIPRAQSHTYFPQLFPKETGTNHHAPAQGFLEAGTDIRPIVPALEKIWADSMGRSLSDFNFRSVTSKFNELVFEYPIRIPERYALVIRCGACPLPHMYPMHACLEHT